MALYDRHVLESHETRCMDIFDSLQKTHPSPTAVGSGNQKRGPIIVQFDRIVRRKPLRTVTNLGEQYTTKTGISHMFLLTPSDQTEFAHVLYPILVDNFVSYTIIMPNLLKCSIDQGADFS